MRLFGVAVAQGQKAVGGYEIRVPFVPAVGWVGPAAVVFLETLESDLAG